MEIIRRGLVYIASEGVFKAEGYSVKEAKDNLLDKMDEAEEVRKGTVTAAIPASVSREFLSAYNQGKAACSEGFSLRDNPYKITSEQYSDWSDGFVYRQAEIERAKKNSNLPPFLF